MGWSFYTPDVDASIGTALPSNPVDGQEFTLVDSLSAPTYSWKFRYVSAKSSNKWVFVGGAPAVAAVTASEAVSNTAAYVDPTTAGPTISLPYAGDYYVHLSANAYADTDYRTWYFAAKAGTATASDDDAAYGGNTNSGVAIRSYSRSLKKTYSAAMDIKMVYKAGTLVGGSPTITFSQRVLTIVPIAIGG